MMSASAEERRNTMLHELAYFRRDLANLLNGSMTIVEGSATETQPPLPRRGETNASLEVVERQPGCRPRVSGSIFVDEAHGMDSCGFRAFRGVRDTNWSPCHAP